LERGSSWLKAAHVNSDVGAGNLIDELARSQRASRKCILCVPIAAGGFISFPRLWPTLKLLFFDVLFTIFFSLPQKESECVKFYLPHTIEVDSYETRQSKFEFF
jgi:hypothetical protein